MNGYVLDENRLRVAPCGSLAAEFVEEKLDDGREWDRSQFMVALRQAGQSVRLLRNRLRQPIGFTASIKTLHYEGEIELRSQACVPDIFRLEYTTDVESWLGEDHHLQRVKVIRVVPHISDFGMLTAKGRAMPGTTWQMALADCLGYKTRSIMLHEPAILLSRLPQGMRESDGVPVLPISEAAAFVKEVGEATDRWFIPRLLTDEPICDLNIGNGA